MFYLMRIYKALHEENGILGRENSAKLLKTPHPSCEPGGGEQQMSAGQDREKADVGSPGYTLTSVYYSSLETPVAGS